MNASIGQRSDREVAYELAQSLKREIEIGRRHGERQTQMTRPSRPEASPGQDRQTMRFEQPSGQLLRRETRLLFEFSHVGEHVERAAGPGAVNAGQAIQLVEHKIPATFETCHRRRYRVLRSGEGRQSRELYERRSTGGAVDDQR